MQLALEVLEFAAERLVLAFQLRRVRNLVDWIFVYYLILAMKQAKHQMIRLALYSLRQYLQLPIHMLVILVCLFDALAVAVLRPGI